MEQLKRYRELQQEIHKYFGYEEQWKIFPLDDCTEYYWCIDPSGDVVHFVEDAHGYEEEDSTYTNAILRGGGTGVWRGAKYTMICCDTQTDDNKLLCIFDNAKERT